MKNIFISFVATVIIQLVTMLGGILSARLLLPQGKGELTAIMLWPSLIASLGSLGIYDAVAFFIANDSKYGTKTIFASGMLLAVVLSCALMGIGYVVQPIVLSNYGVIAINTSLLFIWYIPLALITSCLMAVMLGKLRLSQYNFLRTFVHIGNVFGMVALYLSGKVSVRSFAAAFLISSSVTLLLAAGFLVRRGWIGWLPELGVMKRLLAYGLKVHVGSVAGFLNMRLDQMLLSVLLLPSVLGVYVVAVSIGFVASLVATTIGLVAFPHVANLASEQLKRQAFGRFMRLSLFMSLILAGVLYIFTPQIIVLFFGVAYLEATDPARVLTFASIPLGCNILFAAGFKAFNFPLLSGKSEVIGLAVTGASLMVLLPSYQALGAAWASLLSYSASFLYMAGRTNQIGLTLPQLLLPNREDLNYLKHLLPRMSRRLGISEVK